MRKAPDSSPRPREPAVLTAEAVKQELRELLGDFTDRLQRIVERFEGDPRVLMSELGAMNQEIRKLFTPQPDMPSPESLPEPTIDLSGNVPEQVAQLCRWFRARMAEADTFAEADRELRRRQIVTLFETQINMLTGHSFGADGNAAIVKDLRETLKAVKCRVQCDCGCPGLPRYQSAKNTHTKNGAFTIVIYCQDGQTFHGGPTTFPGYTIIPAPRSLPAERPQPHSRKRSR